jgi:hypothetical protein
LVKIAEKLCDHIIDPWIFWSPGERYDCWFIFIRFDTDRTYAEAYSLSRKLERILLTQISSEFRKLDLIGEEVNKLDEFSPIGRLFTLDMF